MKVVCPRCGYSWVPRRGRRTKRFTCPNCNYSFIDHSFTTTATTTATTARTSGFRKEDIKVYDLEVPSTVLDELRSVAEEVSPPDKHGVEVMVLDADVADEILRRHGIVLEDRVE